MPSRTPSAALGTLLNYWNNYDQPLLNCFYSITSPTRSLQVIPVIQQRPLLSTPISRSHDAPPKGHRTTNRNLKVTPTTRQATRS